MLAGASKERENDRPKGGKEGRGAKDRNGHLHWRSRGSTLTSVMLDQTLVNEEKIQVGAKYTTDR